MSQQPTPPMIPPNMLQVQQQQQPPPNMLPPPGSYYPDGADHDLTGGLPINLDSLRDGPPGSKPFYPYSTLIRYAIKGSPTGKLLLEDIYYAIESRFPYFRSAPPGWKNSVRHNLSLNPCFEKVPRPLTDRGKGSYWTVNDNVDPRTGVHRVRKKKPKKSDRQDEEENAVDYHSGGTPQAFDDPHAQFVQQPPMLDDGAGPSRQPPPFPPPYPPFDPSFPMMGHPAMAYPPAMALVRPEEEGMEIDEHGNINWRLAWLKELSSLQQLSAEQEKAGVEQEWYRMMLYRVRGAFAPVAYPEGVVSVHPPHGMGPPGDMSDQQHPDQ
ncbi:hypothetical protein JAAARDRAFT_28293 [Jaapia argillacea MUCL 33604]|uniref:Fork-head domain-containing protein n=1 Tax=Jaapia argillacea MUCL 33604 TaxID=933084 RepID=A0A067QM98_9AGAM|nr:hypothetical protein JAAARDRAFT_28293 [Jaapia argillacea MUCL 33604]